MFRFLGFVLVLLLVVGLIGWGVGWWSVRADSTGNEHSVSVGVNSDKIDRDLDKAKDAVKGLGSNATPNPAGENRETVLPRVGEREAKGEVRSKDGGGLSIAMADGTTQRFELASDLEVLERGVKVGSTAIDVGDRLTVHYELRDGNRIARRILLGGMPPN